MRPKARKRFLVAGVLIMGSMVLGPTIVIADLYAAPARPLSSLEVMEYTVAGADNIALAFLVSKDTVRVRHDGPHSVPTLKASQWRFKIHRWIKGADNRSNIVVGHNRYRIMPPSLANAHEGQLLLLFLDRVDHERGIPAHARYVPNDNWDYIVAGRPHDVGFGVQTITLPGDDRRIGTLQELVNAQKPDSLIVQADAILYGRANFDNTVPCLPFGKSSSCIPFSVQTNLSSAIVPDTILIYSIVPFFKLAEPNSLIFLKVGANGTYELLHGPAGCIPFDKHNKDINQTSFAQWRERIARVNSLGKRGQR